MTPVTRRAFLASIAPALPPAVVEEDPAPRWASIGRMSEFVPGSRRRTQVGGAALILGASEYGFWAERDGGQRVALRSTVGGAIQVDVNSPWPAGRMLSHLTGEPTQADNMEESAE